MKTLTLCAPAKINLFLHITGQRSDGYHNLQTAFQLLDFGDQIELELTDGKDIHLVNALPDVNASDNLVMRAAKLLQNQANRPLSGVKIKLEKRIPIGGGLGGGGFAVCLPITQ